MLCSTLRAALVLPVVLGACASAPPLDRAPPAATTVILVVAAPPNIAAPPSPASSPSVATAPNPPSPAPVTSGNCSYLPATEKRTSGDLTVASPPPPPQQTIPTRMRSNSEGPLTHGGARVWVGRDVPPFVPLTDGTRELFLLDQPPEGFVAFYRDPYGASSCTLEGPGNCSFSVALFACSGKAIWRVTLDPLFSRNDHLEVQDMRYEGGVLYFNEGCQTYSREAQGKCSALVAVDPLAQKVLWRTRPLVSNNTFLVAGRYLITGYGFTAEPDALFLVRRSDGKVMGTTRLPSAHSTLALAPDGVLSVSTYNEPLLRFRAEGFDGDKPRLTALPKGVHGAERLGF